ncbi:MAG: hypothetical protein FWC72_05525 [Oscillospiraceae bacterium]|nr:hypothetical protein [Oscillospiraceae bacterium]
MRNLPEGAVFADLLIRIEQDDPNFVHINEGNLARFGLDAQAEIVGFNADGFMSFTFHYRDADAGLYTNRYSGGSGWVTFARGSARQFEDLRRNYSDMKIALLDYAGNVISVSAQFTLPNDFLWLTYDHQTRAVSVRVRTTSSPWRFIFLPHTIVMIITIALFSIGLEIVIGLFFQFFRKKLLLIFCVNLGTQMAMWVVYLRFMWLWPPLLAILLLEVVIYVTEFVIYRKSPIMADESTRKLLLYTVIANTVSLVLGILVFW